MNATESGLLQSIIEDPDRDDLRLIFADWLSENGREDRAEFIRWQAAGEPIIWRGRDRHEPGRRLWANRSWADSLTALVAAEWPAEVRNAGWEWKWQRGFIATVTCPVEEWHRHGPAIARAHPLEAVVMAGKEPLTDEGVESYFNEPVDPQRVPLAHWLQTDSDDPASISWEIPHWLWHPCLNETFGSREDALKALSRRAIEWARSQP